ncbi:ATP-binding protein [Streptomyces sp. CS7]|uniref:ATP-binding protein n=1 Tax=Streptomyces sp. CS-7 TaxID=2906769 RepID=UPI0021B37BA6|nr:ATP-binding protein [Streptomyces sp. CS-7]MCT6780566.1 ATP-binding protein [Streptomyces sp. CS-7]
MAELPFVLVGTCGEGEPQFEASFPADPAAISPVRRRLKAFLRENGLEHVADDVALICQELMSNAVQHGCLGLPAETTLKIIVVWSDVRLRAAVHDPSDQEPREQGASRSRTSGRGLRLVDELSDRWGVETDPAGAGKAVWTELDHPGNRAS